MNEDQRSARAGGADDYREPARRPAAADSEARDRRHLKLLSIFHYVFSAMCGVFSLFFISHLVIGIVALSNPEAFTDNATGEPLPRLFGILFTISGATIVGLGQIMGVLLIIAGRSLVRRKRYVLCFATACVCCLLMPAGTVLGVFTIIVLVRASVKDLFARQKAASMSRSASL